MPYLLIDVPSKGVLPVLQALASLVPEKSIQLLESKLLPKATLNQVAVDALAEAIVERVQPTARQPMRREALRAALTGWDTFIDQNGAADPNLRNAFGALSKALKPLFPGEASPIDRLVVRRKRFNPKDGRYLGTVYEPTPLGLAVKAILKKLKAI